MSYKHIIEKRIKNYEKQNELSMEKGTKDVLEKLDNLIKTKSNKEAILASEIDEFIDELKNTGKKLKAVLREFRDRKETERSSDALKELLFKYRIKAEPATKEALWKIAKAIEDNVSPQNLSQQCQGALDSLKKAKCGPKLRKLLDDWDDEALRGQKDEPNQLMGLIQQVIDQMQQVKDDNQAVLTAFRNLGVLGQRGDYDDVGNNHNKKDLHDAEVSHQSIQNNGA